MNKKLTVIFSFAYPIPAPTMSLPTRRTSLLPATPMTMDPTAKTTEAARMTGLRPKRSQQGQPIRENSHAAPTCPIIVATHRDMTKH